MRFEGRDGARAAGDVGSSGNDGIMYYPSETAGVRPRNTVMPRPS
jgi:hypothetical protein